MIQDELCHFLQELMHPATFAWYEDHRRLANHLLSSPLLNGERDFPDGDLRPRNPPATPVNVFHPIQRDPTSLETRPSSVLEPFHDKESNDNEALAGYRSKFMLFYW